MRPIHQLRNLLNKQASFAWKLGRIFGLGLVTSFAFAISPPLSRQQAMRVTKNGGDQTFVKNLSRAILGQCLVMMLAIAGLYATLLGFVQVIPALWIKLGIVALISGSLVIAYYQTSPRFARGRLCRYIAQLAVVLSTWDEKSCRNSITEIFVASHLRDTGTGVRIMRRASWGVTRNLTIMGSLAGHDTTREEWNNIGKALIWVSRSLHDPRRRAVGWQCAAELTKFVADPARIIPGTSVSAAHNCVIQPTRKSQVALILNILQTPIVTGVVLALVAVFLKRVFE